jgi:hypothetical protein
MQAATGIVEKFNLGISADGHSCLMIFIDEDQRAMKCLIDAAELNAFIANLSRAAGEMARRRTATGEECASPRATMNVASGAFQMSASDDYIEGALVADTGEIVGIRMCTAVAFQLTRAMLATAPAASAC